MMWGNGMWEGWIVALMTAGTGAFWVVVLAVRGLLPARSERSGDAQRPAALTILRERLARGEVTVEEYEQRRRHLVDGR